ncbi:MAG: flavodoxin [Cellulosilyticum sp.]|nr:flavodoxin [Cellulosilyticum sp.]
MIKVIYWSGTGNTKNMAEYIGQGIKEKGKEVDVLEISNATENDIVSAEILALGCPAMGCEELEDSEVIPFIEANEALMKDKKVVLFGSYGWGNGEWMETWKEQMESLGAKLVTDPLIVNEFTQGQDEEICLGYGRQIVG